MFLVLRRKYFFHIGRNRESNPRQGVLQHSKSSGTLPNCTTRAELRLFHIKIITSKLEKWGTLPIVYLNLNQSIFQVDSHETKLEELEVLVKSQAELIQELKSKQVELTSALDTKQVELEAAIAEQKVQAAQELSDVKVALEQSQDQAKVSLAQQLEQQRDRGEERQVGLACKHTWSNYRSRLQIADQDYSWTKVWLTTGREEFEQFI